MADDQISAIYLLRPFVVLPFFLGGLAFDTRVLYCSITYHVLKQSINDTTELICNVHVLVREQLVSDFLWVKFGSTMHECTITVNFIVRVNDWRNPARISSEL